MADPRTTVLRHLRESRGLLVFLALMLVFRSTLADWNSVPTGSMEPTIVPGDRILVDRIAYDVRVPFTHLSLRALHAPARGDIVVFDSAVAGTRLVKRVVGLPGDLVWMRDNRLRINGVHLDYRVLAREGNSMVLEENLLGVRHRVRVHVGGSKLSDFGPVRVPPGQFLMLGDNRDDSADSRVIGMVPRGELLGRTRTVMMSLDADDHYLPRPARFLKSI